MHWTVEAARPRTLPAAVAPVVVGTAAARLPLEDTRWGHAALALVVALALQVAVNYANDLFDGLSGVDTADRTGPRRAVASGLTTPRSMAYAMFAVFAVAASAGLVLAWRVGWELLGVGALAIVAALGYSGGRRPYASRGLGEFSVFVFFGLVATVGSQYVQDGMVATTSVVAAVPIGLLAVALLVVNNLRDIATDVAAGKRTLAVRMGDEATRILLAGLVFGAIASSAVVAVVAASGWPLLALAVAPLGIAALRRVASGARGTDLISVLERLAQLQLLYAMVLAAGLVVARLG